MERGNNLKIIAYVNAIPIERLTEEERRDFENYILKTFIEAGYRLHKRE